MSTDHHFISETHYLAGRIEKHNFHPNNKAYSKRASDWKYVLTKACSTKKGSLLRAIYKKNEEQSVYQKNNSKP